MPPAEQLRVSDAVALLLCITLAGVVVRRRARLLWSFPLYLGALIVGNRATTWWPEVFYTHGFWLLKSNVYTALTVLFALEVAALTFVRAPRARRRAFVAIGAIALVAAASAAVAAPAVPAWLLPRGETAALWAMTAVLVLAAWHRIPIHRYHKAIIVARTMHLTFSVILLGVLARNHSEPTYAAWAAYFSALEPLAFASSVCVWCWAAWRPLELRTGVIARLQPWAARA